MVPKWYRDWFMSHLTKFGVVNADNVAMFGTWWSSFTSWNVTSKELYAATETIHKRPKHPAKVSDHYQEIRQIIAADRDAELKRTETDYDSDRGTCTDCGNAGFVAVPHPRFCDAMEWRPTHKNEHGDSIYATAAVLCKCVVGRRMIAAQAQIDSGETRSKRSMTLEHYEQCVNSSWKNQIEERREQIRSHLRKKKS